MRVVIHLRLRLRERAFRVMLGLLGLGAALSLIVASFVLALTQSTPALGFLLLLGLGIGGLTVAERSHSFLTTAWAQPRIDIDGFSLILDAPSVLRNRQLIPRELIRSVHVGPDAASWMVAAYARSSEVGKPPPVHLGRMPQLPNLLIILDRQVLFTEARDRMLRLWHLSAPPAPTRPTRMLWATVEDPDSTYLALVDWGIDCRWITPEAELEIS